MDNFLWTKSFILKTNLIFAFQRGCAISWCMIIAASSLPRRKTRPRQVRRWILRRSEPVHFLNLSSSKSISRNFISRFWRSICWCTHNLHFYNTTMVDQVKCDNHSSEEHHIQHNQSNLKVISRITTVHSLLASWEYWNSSRNLYRKNRIWSIRFVKVLIFSQRGGGPILLL